MQYNAVMMNKKSLHKLLGATKTNAKPLRKLCKWQVILLLVVACIILAFVFLPTVIGESSNLADIEDELSDNVGDRLDELDLSELETFEKMLNGDKVYSGGISKMIEDIIAGKFTGSPELVFDVIFSLLGVSIKGMLPLLVTLVAIAIIFSILNGLSSGFMSKSTTELIYFVCYATMIVLLMTSIAGLVKSTVDTISTMSQLMNIVFPILVTLVTSLGGIVTAGIYQPMMAILSVGCAGVINAFILPCFIATMVLSIVGYVSHNVKLDKLTKFFKSAGGIVLGCVFSLFMTFVTIQGITGAVADSISIKSAKFAISSYVPILGGYLSDGFDLVLASVVLVKNSIGMCSVLVMISIVLAPVINITIFLLGLRLISGIIEPIGDSRMSEILYAISENLTLLIAAILGMAFMFFLMIGLVIMTCNMGV